MLVLFPAEDNEILSEYNFRELPILDRQSRILECTFLMSDLRHGLFLVIEKVDDAIEVFPIVNNKIVPPTKERFWLDNGYHTHFSVDDNIIQIKPTHFFKTDKRFLLKRIRGNPTMTMHYGHFILDELNFLRCFLSLDMPDQYFFFGNYDKAWQLSLLSFFFPSRLSIISKSHQHTSLLDSGRQMSTPSGIFKRVCLVSAPYSIIRINNSDEPWEQIGITSRLLSRKYVNSFPKLQGTAGFIGKVALLERRRNTRYPKRWLNAREVMQEAVNELRIDLDVYYPEEHDPLSLALSLSRYKYIFSEPGSAHFLGLNLASAGQRYYIPHCLYRKNADHWPSCLIDLKAFRDIITLFHGSPDNGNEYGQWETQFTVQVDQIIELLEGSTKLDLVTP